MKRFWQTSALVEVCYVDGEIDRSGFADLDEACRWANAVVDLMNAGAGDAEGISSVKVVDLAPQKDRPM